MQFLFNLLNHNHLGQRSLEDVIGIIGHQLEALGHRAVYRPENDGFLDGDSGINIIVEGFTPYVIEKMAEAHAKGARFLILATEEPTERGFNHGTQPEMVMRQKTFPDAAKFAEGIIHLVPGQHVTDWYSQFAPTAYTELGYAYSLVRANDFEPTYDFGFFGSISPRRWSILKRLAKRIGTPKAVKVEGTFASQEDRDRVMRQACVIVQIRKFDEMGLVSSSRCNTALCLGRPVVAEPHELSKPWDEIVSFSKTLDGFYDKALMVRASWRAVHRQQMSVFREKLSPMNCIGSALNQLNIDLTDRLRRRA